MKLSRELTAKILAQVDGVTRPPKRGKVVAAPAPQPVGNWSITLAIDCEVMSEVNHHEHWTVKHRRAATQRIALHSMLIMSGLANHSPPLPLVVTWTRIGRQRMDDDNLRSAFKALRDALAKWLGVDDGDASVQWQYEDRSGEPGVEVTIGNRLAGE